VGQRLPHLSRIRVTRTPTSKFSFNYLSSLLVLRNSQLFYLYAMDPHDVSAAANFSLRSNDPLFPGDIEDFSLGLALSDTTSTAACDDFFEVSFGMFVFLLELKYY
jgi:hypothetical protein